MRTQRSRWVLAARLVALFACTVLLFLAALPSQRAPLDYALASAAGMLVALAAAFWEFRRASNEPLYSIRPRGRRIN